MNALEQIPQAPPAATLMLDLPAVAGLLDISTRTVERMVVAGRFPKPIKMNKRGKRWSREAVEG